MLFSPPAHGQLGLVDELLLYCLPLIIVIVVLAITSLCARQKEERVRQRTTSMNHGDTENVKHET